MEFEVGQRASVSRTVTEADVVNFAGVSGDFNPVHVDAEYARATRFGQRVAHGLLTASIMSSVLGMQIPGPGAIYLGQTLKFLKPVFIGDTVTAHVEVTGWTVEKRRVILNTWVEDQRGEKVLEGEANLLVPA
ncbi:MAG: MaoC family dehydratase [Bacillota bacterium]|nr:MaoC family dehydratase [Bacillota bacterium]